MYGIALSKGGALLPSLSAAVTSMVEDGTIERLPLTWLLTGIDALSVLP